MSPDQTQPLGERVAALEAAHAELKADVSEIKADVKTLLAAHNRQQGFVMLGKLAWGGLCASLALVGEWVVNHWPVGGH